MCSTSVAAADNWKLRINTSIFIDAYCSEIVSGKTATGNMKNCIIKNKVATGVYVRRCQIGKTRFLQNLKHQTGKLSRNNGA